MIHIAFIVALTSLFLHVTTWEGMINSWVGRVCYNCPPWLKKPLYDCPICMAPWWGFVIYGVLRSVDSIGTLSVPALIISLFMAGGVNTVLIYIISGFKEHEVSEP